jgi:putative transposase
VGAHNKVKIEFSRPGKPTDNAFIESFNDFGMNA